MTNTDRFDVAIVGAGMAGASLAAELAPRARVLVIEAEPQPGYHATGRSAAFWTESYGGPAIAPLTRASHGFLASPPKAFSLDGFLRPRGCLHLAGPTGSSALGELKDAFAGTDIALEPLGRPAIESILPWLRSGWNEALWEPSCCDIDVAALHAAYLKAARGHGVVVRCAARVIALSRDRAGWRGETGAGPFTASILVNAAGAWADDVAISAGVRPLGIQPFRRTMAQIRTSPDAACDLPLVIDAEGRFYFKPEPGGRLWITPHDEAPAAAGDVAPEEIDVARAIMLVEQVARWRVTTVERRWAGLRSFAPDRLPVFGFDRRQADFFWFAGQGGFGIQTAPAAARLGAALILGAKLPDLSLDPPRYAPDRFG